MDRDQIKALSRAQCVTMYCYKNRLWMTNEFDDAICRRGLKGQMSAWVSLAQTNRSVFKLRTLYLCKADELRCCEHEVFSQKSQSVSNFSSGGADVRYSHGLWWFHSFFFLFFYCWLDESSNQRMWVPESPCVTALFGADLLLIILSVFTLYSELCHKVFV